MRFFKSIFLIVFALVSSTFAGPEIKVGFGWLPTAELEPIDEGTTYLIDRGVFYDVLSPEISLSWDFGSISFGPRVSHIFSNEIFGDSQETRLREWTLGAEFIYNFKMRETGDLLFPIVVNGGYHISEVKYLLQQSEVNQSGESSEFEILMGLEKIWDSKFSLGFIIGKRFAKYHIENSDFGIESTLNSNDWRFEIYSRFWPMKR